jgi:crotonobetainyl-CoA:carnitine CoA-transferase CaiB-like acyl-CoA transferase
MLASAMNGPLPLDGLRVLELGHIIAGPSAGLLLADLGADVIKVERPGEGDQTRGMPAGNGANFHFLNRNKRSITIDLKGSPEGRALAGQAEVRREPRDVSGAGEGRRARLKD